MSQVDWKVERLELDIDCRLAGLWEDLAGVEPPYDLNLIVRYMRAAYGLGYADAMRDPEPERFFHDNGYHCPERRRA